MKTSWRKKGKYAKKYRRTFPEYCKVYQKCAILQNMSNVYQNFSKYEKKLQFLFQSIANSQKIVEKI